MIDKIHRIMIKNGYVIDPKNGIETTLDIAIEKDEIVEVSKRLSNRKHDLVIDAKKLLVIPGLVDLHLHLDDLFEVDIQPIFEAATDGVTLAFSPGAGNTFMAPALLGAEMDRGLPINAGVLLGAANIIASSLTENELLTMFLGNLKGEKAYGRLTKNDITNRVAHLIIGIKEHMGHLILSDTNIRKLIDLCQKAGLLFMSHTQDYNHARHIVELAEGIGSVHLTHLSAAGCGTHGDPVISMKGVIDLCKCRNVSGDFVTTMIRKGLGSREGLQIVEKARSLCLEALEAGIVEILVSDGQNQSVMKGFGDTRDNIPAIIELAEGKILTMENAIATMTYNPIKLLAKTTKRNWWLEKFGHLAVGAKANITIIDVNDKLPTYTIVNGKIVSFENRMLRNGYKAGYWISSLGIHPDLGIGNIGLYNNEL